MTAITSSLYSSHTGRISCVDHMGSYGQSEYRHAPERREYRTPLDVWERIDADYVEAWVEMMGRPPVCEDCGRS